MKDISEKLAAKDIEGRGLSKNDFTDTYFKRLRGDFKPSNIGTRIFGGRMGELNVTTATTFHITTVTAQHFDAVRLVFANTLQGFATNIFACAASVSESLSDVNNSFGAWVNGTKDGSLNFPLPIAQGNGRIRHTVSDWISLKSVVRADGGVYPILHVRAYIPSHPSLSVYGNGVDSFQNWATKSDGKIWIARSQAGNFVGSPVGFTSTANINQSPIVGIQYLSRGKVISVAACGDSITDGRGTYLGEGFGMPICTQLSDMNSVAIEYSNLGWSGQNTLQFTKRAIEALNGPIRPDILMVPIGSPNDATEEILPANIVSQSKQVQNLIARAKEVGTFIVFWTWLPTNTSVRPYGISDQLRRQANSEFLGLLDKGWTVVDLNTLLSGDTVGGQVQMKIGTTNDNIHPNDAGNEILSNGLIPTIKEIIGI